MANREHTDREESRAARIAIFYKMANHVRYVRPEQMIDTLASMGFFTAPASAGHHGNYEGGLFHHSLTVAESLIDLTKDNNLIWSRPVSPFIVGMFHDLCKVDSYEWIPDSIDCSTLGGQQSVTDEVHGHYAYKKNTLLKGHGDKSIMLLSTIMQLTMEEVACIRYHMGAFTYKEEWADYSRAVAQFPNVLWTHQADMIASQLRGI